MICSVCGKMLGDKKAHPDGKFCPRVKPAKAKPEAKKAAGGKKAQAKGLAAGKAGDVARVLGESQGNLNRLFSMVESAVMGDREAIRQAYEELSHRQKKKLGSNLK